MRPVTRVPARRGTSGRPTVTLVLPCYSDVSQLAQRAEAAFEEPGVDVRLIVVDDACPVGSRELAQQLADGDARVSLIRHDVPAGPVQTCNDALARVGTDYVALLEDPLPPGDLSRAVSLMERRPHVGLVHSEAGQPVACAHPGRPRPRGWTVWSGEEWIRLAARYGRCPAGSRDVVMRTAALRSVGLYDHRLAGALELDLWLRIALYWDIARINGRAQSRHAARDLGTHRDGPAEATTDLRWRRAAFEIFFDEHATDRPDIQALRPTAMRALAWEALGRALAAHGEGADPTDIGELTALAADLDPSVVGPGRPARWLPRLLGGCPRPAATSQSPAAGSGASSSRP